MLAVIQARVGSARLPGKVLRPLGGRPVLSWVLRAAITSHTVEHVVVATTDDPADDPVARLAEREGAGVVRGPDEDVLRRFVLVLDAFGDQPVIRLTADCPLLDPAVISLAAGAFDPERLDYLSTVTPRTLPRGLDVEVVAARALRRADREAAGADRAHVTSYLYRRPATFRIAGLTFAPPADDLRVTLDTPEDARLLDGLVTELGDRPPPWREVVAALRARPDLVALNAGVRQRPLEEG